MAFSRTIKMFRLLARILCGLLACALAGLVVTLVLSNRAETVITLTPLPYELVLPVYLVIALSFILGLFVGLVLYLNLKFRTSLERRRLRRQMATMRPGN